MNIPVSVVLESYRPSWLAYAYGDRDPQVKAQAKLFELWLSS